MGEEEEEDMEVRGRWISHEDEVLEDEDEVLEVDDYEDKNGM